MEGRCRIHMNNRYDEIINLPHHVSKTRPRMPMSDRAAQFAPFAALTGYDSAIKETGRLTDERIELDEGALTALNMRYQLLMDALDEEPEVEITYFKPDERKAGGEYVTAPARSKRSMILSAGLPCRTARRFRWMMCCLLRESYSQCLSNIENGLKKTLLSVFFFFGYLTFLLYLSV